MLNHENNLIDEINQENYSGFAIPLVTSFEYSNFATLA